jgi:hypothetical protein
LDIICGRRRSFAISGITAWLEFIVALSSCLARRQGHISWFRTLAVSSVREALQQNMDYQGFIREYKSYLNDLTFNSKALINTLTMLAGENVPAATSIQQTIEDQIILVRRQLKHYRNTCLLSVGSTVVFFFRQGRDEEVDVD